MQNLCVDEKKLTPENNEFNQIEIDHLIKLELTS